MYETNVFSPKLSRYIIFYAHNKIPTMQENKESDIQTYKLKFLQIFCFTSSARIREKGTRSTKVYRTSCTGNEFRYRPVSVEKKEEKRKKRE